MSWSKNKVFRTTRCFSPKTNGYPGGFPIGFLKWVKENGWWGEKRCYLCAGAVKDEEATRIDLNPKTKPTYVEDARCTRLPPNYYDWVMIDPPYSKELAQELYGLGKEFGSINQFTKEAERITKPDGLILTLSYEVPKRIKGCNLVACVGVYQSISVAHMRCFTVWVKGNNLKEKQTTFRKRGVVRE